MPPLSQRRSMVKPLYKIHRRKKSLVVSLHRCATTVERINHLDELLPEYMGKLKILGVSLDNHESTKARQRTESEISGRRRR